MNLLTIIPNETYEAFAAQYQEQIKEVYGTLKAGSELRRNHKGKEVGKKTITRNNTLFRSNSFIEFWNKLSTKTDFIVTFDEDILIDKSIEVLSQITVSEYEAEIILTKIKAIYGNELNAEELGRETEKLKGNFSPLDIAEVLSQNTNLSIKATMRILRGLSNYREIIKNPHKFIQEASLKIKNIKLDEMFRTLIYSINGEKFDIKHFKETFETYQKVKETPNRGIYDKAICDSDVESEFALKADKDGQVVCFAKLPNFYRIKTPIGEYNPDWGIVVKKQSLRNDEYEELYFVIETKGTNDIEDKNALTEAERYKIKCAMKHFEALGIDAKIKYIGPAKDYQEDFKRRV